MQAKKIVPATVSAMRPMIDAPRFSLRLLPILCNPTFVHVIVVNDFDGCLPFLRTVAPIVHVEFDLRTVGIVVAWGEVHAENASLALRGSDFLSQPEYLW